jgi:hypothetical protein
MEWGRQEALLPEEVCKNDCYNCCLGGTVLSLMSTVVLVKMYFAGYF